MKGDGAGPPRGKLKKYAHHPLEVRAVGADNVDSGAPDYAQVCCELPKEVERKGESFAEEALPAKNLPAFQSDDAAADFPYLGPVSLIGDV